MRARDTKRAGGRTKGYAEIVDRLIGEKPREARGIKAKERQHQGPSKEYQQYMKLKAFTY